MITERYGVVTVVLKSLKSNADITHSRFCCATVGDFESARNRGGIAKSASLPQFQLTTSSEGRRSSVRYTEGDTREDVLVNGV